MLRNLLVTSMLFLITGCGEMKVIGDAAMRELKADGINVERTSYRVSKK